MTDNTGRVPAISWDFTPGILHSRLHSVLQLTTGESFKRITMSNVYAILPCMYVKHGVAYQTEHVECIRVKVIVVKYG